MYSFRRSNPLPLLRTCLARSRRHNISVFFDYLVPTVEEKVKEMVHLLIDNCERWHSLEISNHCLEIHDLLGKVRGRVPNLKSLVIRCEPARASPLAAFEFAPQLRTVKVHDGVGRRQGIVLTHASPFFGQCHDLQTFTRLQRVPSPYADLMQKSIPIILPELRHFHGSHRDLIQRVTTPNLESFHLDMFFPIRSFYDNLLLNIRDLFIRSRCLGLSKLTLSNAVTSHILDILPLLPGLAVLMFQFSGWRDGGIEEEIFRSMFQQMTDVDEVGMLKVVPNLREFSFKVAQRHLSCILCLDGIFLDMVASRAKTLEKVEAIGTVPSDIWSSKQVSVFEGLLKDGMDISLNSLRPWDFSGGLDDSIIADHCVKDTWPRHISTLVRSP
ncbi:hypothetical protein EV421DRAFT_2038879 [Armillaria borealis]|uniref:Uncharacterized protein n=1 Tax=Armillaria borealis TaxID=47425 RepID=A0AA39MJW8_9AGAR|nr:hypothetical protein EV421DRAFT_2038879 [Armillaria borealis]